MSFKQKVGQILENSQKITPHSPKTPISPKTPLHSPKSPKKQKIYSSVFLLMLDMVKQHNHIKQIFMRR